MKRLSRPVPGDPAARSDPHHFGYWRREADVALDDVLHQTSGLRAPEVLRVDEDDEGVVVWQAPVDQVDLTGPFRAQALGRFDKCTVGERPWSSRQGAGPTTAIHRAQRGLAHPGAHHDCRCRRSPLAAAKPSFGES
ncbi:MAG: hypothetical protein V9E81_15070 [Marmoricola sp.]